MVSRFDGISRARNEERTFRLEYTVTGAIRKHLDAAELWWAFVGPDWSRPFRHIEARIEFASPISSSDLETRAWWRGSRPTRSLLPGDGSVRGVVENHPPQIQLGSPDGLFASAGADLVQATGVAALEQIVAETSGWERELQERLRREREERQERARMAALLFP